MHIAFSSDDGYVQHMAAVWASLLTNLKPGITPQFYVVTDGISDENKAKLESLKTSIRDFNVTYLPVTMDDFKIYPMTLQHLNMVTYFRLKLPSLLPHLDKLIYLDIDTIVDGDISAMWDIELSPDEWIAGVQDLIVDQTIREKIGMASNDHYFNAGICIMNLAAMRRNDFEKRCVAFVEQYGHAIRYVDQDVLNHVCLDHVKWIHPKYNFMYGEIYKVYHWDRYHMPYTPQVMKEATRRPVIIHYVGPAKPWFYKSRNIFARKYRRYLKMTPWKDYRFADRNFRTFRSNQMFFLRKRLQRLVSRK